jgi:hypothetical protein
MVASIQGPRVAGTAVALATLGYEDFTFRASHAKFSAGLGAGSVAAC